LHAELRRLKLAYRHHAAGRRAFCGRADRRGHARTGNSDPGYVNTNPVVVERPSNFELVDGATVPDILKPGELADNTLD
jgi:hypothetical protein